MHPLSLVFVVSVCHAPYYISFLFLYNGEDSQLLSKHLLLNMINIRSVNSRMNQYESSFNDVQSFP